MSRITAWCDNCEDYTLHTIKLGYPNVCLQCCESKDNDDDYHEGEWEPDLLN